MPAKSPRILVLFAHPNQHNSEVNQPMLRATRRMKEVTVVDLYATYPDMHIDADREQARLRKHEIIIFMHPIYWYSTPAILKQWQDIVLESGFAYGDGGTALHGKTLFCATSTGGHAGAYSEEGYNNFTLRQLLVPIEQTAFLCGMTYLPPFALFGARQAMEAGQIGPHIAEWRRLISALANDRFDLEKAHNLEMLNGNLDQLIRRD